MRRIESDRANPTTTAFLKVAKALEITVSDLFNAQALYLVMYHL